MQEIFEKLWRIIFWKINRNVVPFVIKAKYGKFLKISGDTIPKTPFIFVANHANFLDPWIVCHLSKSPVAIMMNEDGFKASAFQRWYLKNIGAFPKKKGMSDISAMKKSISAIKAGFPLMVFPEGQTSWDGETQPIYPGIERMAQKMGVALVMCRIESNFIAHPWWAANDRKGQVSIIIKVLDKKAVKETNPDDLRSEIIIHIKTNDIEKSKNKKFTGENIVLGMQNFIWRCPVCGKIEELVFSGNKISCKNCKNDFVFNANLWIENPKNDVNNLYEWVKMQKDFVKNFVKNANENETLCENNRVSLIQNDYGGRITILDTGKLQISKEKIIFFGDSAKIEVLISDIIAPVFQQKNIIQFEYPKGELKFLFKNSPMMKHLFFLRELTDFSDAEERGYFI